MIEGVRRKDTKRGEACLHGYHGDRYVEQLRVPCIDGTISVAVLLGGQNRQ